ncbi:MAG: hypothetical protein ACKUBY_01075 [Candidatus Moraniibacteriota bacterium]|jgi:hypothetical protein
MSDSKVEEKDERSIELSVDVENREENVSDDAGFGPEPETLKEKSGITGHW